jgi:DNA-binding NarL/FixJ family response regulator
MAVKETTALIVTRYAFFRQALRVYLENIGGIRVAASADNGLEALSLSEQMRPDLLIADAQCPGIDKLQESFLSKSKFHRPSLVLFLPEESELYHTKKGAWADSCLLQDELFERLPDVINDLLNRRA